MITFEGFWAVALLCVVFIFGYCLGRDHNDEDNK